MRSRGLLSLIGLLMALVLLGACSSGSGSSTLDSTTSSTQSSVGTGGSSGSLATGGTDTGSVATGSDDTGSQLSGDSNSDFCNDFRHYNSYFSDHSGDSNSEDEVLDAYKKLKSDAPASLQGDLQTIIDFAEQLQDLDTNDLSGYEDLSQKAEKAFSEVARYVSQVCGIDIS